MNSRDKQTLIMKYFVLKPSAKGWHGKASRAALEAYEKVLRENNEIEFAEDLRLWRAECQAGADADTREMTNTRSPV